MATLPAAMPPAPVMATASPVLPPALPPATMQAAAVPVPVTMNAGSMNTNTAPGTGSLVANTANHPDPAAQATKAVPVAGITCSKRATGQLDGSLSQRVLMLSPKALSALEAHDVELGAKVSFLC